MTDRSDDIPTATAEPRQSGLFERTSFVWLIPIGAVLVALGVAWSNYASRGPVIRIAFDDAAGIAAQETEIRYRNVSIGVVESVKFARDLSQVIVEARIDKDVAPFVDGDASFWIVQPEVSASGVSGLETVLSGVYIEGTWDQNAEGTQFEFIGLEDPPLLTTYRRGVRFELRTSRESGLSENTPILFKGIEVGRLGPARISNDGEWVYSEAIIYSPHDSLVTTATRFWDTSGFSFSIGPNGAELDFSSVASLIAGGITFDTLVSGGQPIRNGLVFEVYPDETTARASIFEANDGRTVQLSMIFEENVSGLATGAPVEWRGVRIGEVANVNGVVDTDRFGDARVRLQAVVELTPSRFGLTEEPTEEEVFDFLSARIDEGLRARLVTASILTGGLKIELLTVEDAEPAALGRPATEPFPTFPVTESEIDDVTATAESVFERVNSLPFEELLDSAIGFLDNATAFMADPELRDTPAELRGLLSDARGVIGSEAVQTLPDDLSAVMADIRSATEDLRTILASVEEADAVNRVVTAVESAGRAAEAAETALEGIPALTERVTAFAEQATELTLDSFVTEATELARSANTLVSGEAAQALPANLQEAVATLDGILTDIAEEGTAAQLSSALQSVEEAAAAFDTATAGVPELTDRLAALADKANALPLDSFVNEATGLAEDARGLFGREETQTLPADLSAAVDQLTALLSQINEADTTGELNRALSAASEAATAVEEATAGVPEVVARIDRIAANAEEVQLQRLADELAGVLETARQLFGDASEADLPAALSGALTEAEGAISELREGGVIDATNRTLASAREAAAAIETAAADLPALVDRIARALSQAESTLSGYDGDSQFARQTEVTLREIERAAEAITDLARTIERRPNSIILGR